MPSLPPGFILAIARDAGLQLKGAGDKRACRCPFHDDKNASAFVSVPNNAFHCSSCGLSLSAKNFCERLGLDWNNYLRDLPRESAPTPPRSTAGGFTASDAVRTCAAAFARARDDDAVDDDRNVYDYLSQRRLTEAYDLGVYGVLASAMSLHPAIAHWLQTGHRIVAPLYDLRGRIMNIQGRTISRDTRKTLVPKDTTVSGRVFGDRRGACVLRGEHDPSDAIVFGEGLTDMIALAISSPVPVLTAPGTSNAVAAVGSWARARRVLLALDCDQSGNAAVGPVAHALRALGATRIQRIVWPTRCKDACDLVAAHGVVALAEFLSHQLAQEAA